MLTSDFDYHLPTDRIAQRSVEPKDHAKLLLVDREQETLTDHHVFDLPTLLRPGDLLVFNDTKVFKARLHGTCQGKSFEIFLLKTEEDTWQALIRSSKKLTCGDDLDLPDGSHCTVMEKRNDGIVTLDFHRKTEDVFAYTDIYGQVPSPPYVDQVTALDQYQTIYAKQVGSVAAPTAGFHFTAELLEALTQKGIQQAFVTLHVGIGTFRPMMSQTLEEHVMHEEWGHVPQETWKRIQATKESGGRVIAVGTTTVRALESGGTGATTLFITPGYQFKVIDGLLTNFHLPKSTLLVLVSAFAGTSLIQRAYQHAIDHQYRFYSFGDAMLII